VRCDPRSAAGWRDGLEKWLDASGLGGVPSAMLFEKPVVDEVRRTKARKKGTT
jgi:hypothetical protein